MSSIMPAQTNPADDSFFNDLSRRQSGPSDQAESPQDQAYGQEEIVEAGDVGILRARRIACVICRKRKLKCDGSKPSCGTCSRLKHKCAYDEVRKKSGPKRGYVKELEARLAQVETQLKSKDKSGMARLDRASSYTVPQPSADALAFQLNDVQMGLAMDDQEMMQGFMSTASISPNLPTNVPTAGPDDLGESDTISWEMIGLGLQEPLPPQEMIDELHQIYFNIVHPSIPMIHRYRYFAAMALSTSMRPPICLRYIMWALACTMSEKYCAFSERYYERARRYAESDEMKGHGEVFITVAHAQTWALICTYEFKCMYFPRAWVSCGKSTRLAQMMGLNRLDGEGLEVKQCIKPPQDWTEREERRRTFWAAYCADRYASIGTGWPMTMDEADIRTHLPSMEEEFDRSQPSKDPMFLQDTMTTDGSASLSAYGGVVVLASLFGRYLTHLHRQTKNDKPDDFENGEFWKRHRALDSILANTSMYLPPHLRLPAGIKDANTVFLNLNIHAANICLHQSAIMQAEQHNLGKSLIRKSTDQCFAAAEEILSIMRMICHIELGSLNPFTAFCLYVAARIFVHAYKKQPRNSSMRANLEFLLNSMQAGQRKNPLASTFLVQIMVDLDGLELDIFNLNTPRAPFGNQSDYSQLFKDGEKCHKLMLQLSDTQLSFHELQQQAEPPTNPSATKNSSNPYSSAPFSIPTREPRAHADYSSKTRGIPIESEWKEKIWAADPRDTSSILTGPSPFDTEMSSENTSDRPNSISNHPTPTNSHQGSSNTSYSPPVVNATIDSLPHSQQQQDNAFAAFPMTSYTDLGAAGDPFARMTSRSLETPRYEMPVSWDLNQAFPQVLETRQGGWPDAGLIGVSWPTSWDSMEGQGTGLERR